MRTRPLVRESLVVGLLLALLVLWPGWLWPSSVLIGDEGLENWAHAWGMWWFVDRLVHGDLPWDAPGLNFPRGGVLWYIDPIGAVLTSPLQLIWGPVVAYWGLVMAQVTFAGAAGYAWGRQHGGISGGLVAAAATATFPWFQGELHNGISEACWVGFVPLSGVLAARESRWTGVCVGLAAVGTPYHGVSAALLAGGQLLFTGRFRLLLETALLSALIAAPPFAALQASLTGDGTLADKAPPGLNIPTLRMNAIDPKALWTPGDYWTVHQKAPIETPFKRTPYLGWLLVSAALLGGMRAPRLLWLWIPAAMGAVFALGPLLWVDGDFARGPDGQAVVLPFRWVQWATGVTMDHPLRFVAGTGVALAGLAAAAMRGRYGWLLVPAVLVEFLTIAPNAWPLQVSVATVPSVYEAIPDDGRAIVDLPADRGISFATKRYLYYQTVHQHPILYTTKVSSDSFDSMNQALRHWTAATRRFPIEPGTPGAPDPSADLVAATQELVDQGFGWVVLHRGLLLQSSDEWAVRKVVDPLLGAPREVGGDLVWSLPHAEAQKK